MIPGDPELIGSRRVEGLRDEVQESARVRQRAVAVRHAFCKAWQLAERGLRVTAVDNASLRGGVRSDPLVDHVQTDGLKYRPRRPVDWMVCDIVEKPSRIAALVGDWVAEGRCRRTIFNLKLPMKKRYDEVQRCEQRIGEVLQRAHAHFTLRVKQLYHDREEVTAYLARR